MTIRQVVEIALRQILDPGDGLSGFLSRLSILGLAIAVALLLAVMSVMNGFEQEMRQRILGLVPHVTVRGSADIEAWQLLQQQLVSSAGVVAAEPFYDTDVLALRGRSAQALRLLGTDGSLARYAGLLSDNVSQLGEGEVLLGAGLARRLALKPGDTLTFIAPTRQGGTGRLGQPSKFRLRALITTGTELDEQLAIAQQSAVAALAGSDVATNGIAVRVDDLFAAGRWRWQLSTSLPAWFYVNDWTQTHGNLYSAIHLSRNLILLLMASIIAVAAFNVVSSLVLVVTDRARSIAMLRAVGAQQRSIVAIYLAQGALIGGFGALVGSALGWLLAVSAPGLAELISEWRGQPLLNTDVYPIGFLPVAIRGTDFLLVGGTALLLCLLAAALPAWRASRLPVAATLSH